MTRSIAFYALHYGAEYLAHSIRSVQDAVDEIHVAYAPKPSYGHSRGLVCPDSEQTLIQEAHRFATKQIHWHKGQWHSERDHRSFMHETMKRVRADIALVVDADEVWDPDCAKACVDFVARANSHYRWSAKFEHFWRSFDWTVRDHFRPIRIADIRHYNNKGNLPDIHLADVGAQEAPILHFGYAQRVDVMQYKWTCHGHQSELREGWFANKFLGWSPDTNEPGDLHPCVNNLWDRAYEPTDQAKEMFQKYFTDHPNFGKKLIE